MLNINYVYLDIVVLELQMQSNECMYMFLKIKFNNLLNHRKWDLKYKSPYKIIV